MAPSRRPQQFSNWFKYCRKHRDAVSVERHTALASPPVSSVSQMSAGTAPELQGSWLEAAGAVVLAEIAPGSVRQQPMGIHDVTSLALAQGI